MTRAFLSLLFMHYFLFYIIKYEVIYTVIYLGISSSWVYKVWLSFVSMEKYPCTYGIKCTCPWARLLSKYIILGYVSNTINGYVFKHILYIQKKVYYYFWVTTKTTKFSGYVSKAIHVLKTKMLVRYIRYMYVNISGLDVYMVCICPKK